MLAAEQAVGDPGVDPVELARERLQVRARGSSRALFLSAISRAVSGSAGRISGSGSGSLAFAA